MPDSTLVEKAKLSAEFGSAAYSAPASHEIGLISAAPWTATTVVATGAYGVPSAFVGTGSSAGKVFKATTGGTTGSSQPTWPTSGTVTDGSVTWTEVSALFAAGTITGAEPGGGIGYSRQSITNNGTNWALQSAGNPATVLSGALISFGVTTASWGPLVGYLLLDAAGTNLRNWGLFPAVSLAAESVGVTVEILTNQLTLTQS